MSVPVSADYAVAVKQPTRTSTARINFGIVDVGAAADAVLTDNGHQVFATPSALTLDLTEPGFAMGTFEDNEFLLDGTMYLTPDDARGTALLLDGADDYVTIPNTGAIGTTAFTVEAWINPTNFPARHAIFSTRKNNPAGCWALEIGVGSTNFGNGRLAVTGVGTWIIESQDNAITAGVWQHIAFVRNGGTNDKLYVNGVEQPLFAAQVPYTIVENADARYIGGTQTPTAQFYKGAISDLRVWNSVKTPAQLNADVVGTESDLVGYWKCDDSTGLVLPATKGANGALLNGATWLPATDNLGWMSEIQSDSLGLFGVTPTLTADLVGKVSASFVENKHMVKAAGNGIQSTAPSGVSFEPATSSYGQLSSLNGVLYNTNSTTLARQPLHIFIFDVIALVESYGYFIPGATTSAKVIWLRPFITNLVGEWWGYGSSPTGNKASITRWNAVTNVWDTVNKTHTNGTVSRLTTDGSSNFGQYVDLNGKFQVQVFAEVSDGVTTSNLSTDYADVLINLSLPVPTLTTTFGSTHSSLGLTLNFPVEFCIKFDITWYRGATQLAFEDVTNNTSQTYVSNTAVTDYDKIVIRFLMSVNPYRYARLMSLQFGVDTVFDSNDLINATVVEEVDPSGSTLSINTLKFDVINENQQFNMLNPDGVFAYLQKRQKIKAASALLLPDGSYEYVPLGTFYLSDWKNATGLKASLEATDIIGVLDKTTYSSSPFWVNEPLINALTHILNDAGVTTFTLNENVTEYITGYIPMKSHREALMDVLTASRCYMRIGRNGYPEITRINYATPIEEISYDTIIGLPTIEQKPLVTAVEATEYTYNLSATAVELSKSSITLYGTEKTVIALNSAASAVSVSIVGGTIVGTPKISAAAVELTITASGVVTVTITGKPYVESTRLVTVRVPALLAGEVPQVASMDTDNKLIVNNGALVAQQFLDYSQRRIKQTFYFWDNPSIQSGDVVDVETLYASFRSGAIERQEITFAPTLKARIEVIG